ncbi:MAG: Tol biopolymer transport system-like protein [Acidobacteria bacterium]|nr:Tol biopolymer transport system-like protein [Acidobacteriota bacterium]
MKRITLAFMLLVSLSAAALAQGAADRPLLLQSPTVSRTQIVFSYAGDLWAVDRAGGDARRLTTGTGIETDPRFSPDGEWIAFTGEYDGNVDVYVMAAAGGVPRRLTYHPGNDQAVGWTPDGKKVLFSSTRKSYTNFARLFTVGLDESFPAEMPLPMALRGSLSPDGSHVAYQPLSQWQPDWKHYHGGQTSPIWLANLADSSIEKLPRENSNDTYPMWVGDKIYFISDRGGSASLYAFDTKSKRVAEVVKNDGLDIKSASAGPDAIVYTQFGSINLYDLKTGRATKVPVRVAGDVGTLRPRFEKVGPRIANARLSPTGARAIFEARGEILSVPAEKGDVRNLTNTVGVMERDPAWSPDGKWIAYFSDESGEYALHLRAQNGMGEVKKINLGTPSFFFTPTWSPDSKKIAYSDKRLNLWYVDVEKGTPVKVDKNPDGLKSDVMDPVWAPDSKWIAYTKQLDNHLRAVFGYSIEAGRSHQLTDGMSDARYPDFDKGGKYLYFTASTNLGPAFSFAEMSNFPFQSSRSVYAIVLRSDQPSPLQPESDEEKVQEEKKDEPKGDKPAGDKPEGDKPETPAAPGPAGKPPAKKAPEPVRIDLEGVEQRIVALPIPSRNYVGLAAGKANSFYVYELLPAGAGGPAAPGFVVQKFDVEKRKLDKVVEGVNSFEVSANGEKMLFRQGPNWIIAPTAQPLKPGEGILKTADMEVYVDPRAEWRQMFNEVWRGERDFFYDPNLHGLDIATMKRRYEPYLDSVAHRADLSYLFREMLNNITVGHMFIGGGDSPRPNAVSGGLLGADYEIANGRYRFAKVYNGESWNPNLRAPLTQPGVNVKAGDYLLAVGGREVNATDNIYSFFEGKAGKQVLIKVGADPRGKGAREVTVVPVPTEQGLRALDWIEGNRRKVDQLTGGRLAYVYVPNTSGAGYESFNRYFFAQTQKEGAVIDERFNSGGALADYIVEYLSRPLLNFINFRDGRDVPTPMGAIYGPKAMIINELAGSGGDALPWYFRKMKIGPLVGKRTWGGLIAAFQMPQLMDGGSVTAPDAAIYGLEGQWEVENRGVAPDVEVEFDPAAWRAGRDPQLERAVELVLEELKKNPAPKYKRPAYPIYNKSEK